jgi:hypothetical protein
MLDDLDSVCNSLVPFVSSIWDFLKGKNGREMVNRVWSDYRRVSK